MLEILEQTRSILTSTPQRWTQLLQTISYDLLTRPPAPQEWSAVECLIHMIDVERVFNSRLEAFLVGEDFPAFDPDSEGTALKPELMLSSLGNEFSQLRAASLERLGGITSAQLDTTVRHAELGPVTLPEMLNEWAAHDLSHTVQAETALMQPFIDGCGPWKPFFSSHVVEGVP